MSQEQRSERAELRTLLEQARAYLELEAELGNHALLPVELGPLPEARAQPAPADSLPGPHAPEPAPSAGGGSLPLEERVRRLAVLAEEASTCARCSLHEKRKQAVFARGNPEAELVFVGEGPGAEEDRLGEPFVGPAGKLLDRMVAAMGYARDDVYICNVVKCRPPENRTPRPEEAIACRRYLIPQLELVAPKVIVALGRCAAENLGVARPEGPWRGRWGAFQGTPVLPTYHPAYLLRSPEQKRVVWEDLQLVLARLGRPVPERKR